MSDSMYWFGMFWSYVNRGTYQKFVRDLQLTHNEADIAEINRSIRHIYLNSIAHDFPELGEISLGSDGSTINVQNDSELRRFEPTFTRLMVGNHGAYIEFEEPIDRGIFIRRCLQYNWYERNDVKLYEQFKTVNYADYKIGMWYVDMYAAFGERTPTSIEFKNQMI
jgi:hypothetical protein